VSPTVRIACDARRGAFELELEADLGAPATGVFGRSGAGKSTLLHALAGLLPASRLRLEVDGELLVDSAAGRLPRAHERRVGLVFQDHRLFPHLSVAANLRYGAARGGSGPRLEEVVELLELSPLLTRRPADCSGGERQRVALGRALLGAPRLLLLDEPLASLDRGLKRQILPFLRRVREASGIPLLIVSHDLGDLLALTDEVLLLEGGRAAGCGSVAQLAAEAETLELLHDCGLVFALGGAVAERDADGLTWVRLDGPRPQRLACGDCDAPAGTRVEVQLRPEDIVLTRERLPVRTSLSNELLGRIERITHSPARVLVAIDAGLDVPVLAEVTERAVRRLGLEPGAEVVALCKAQAVRTRRLEP